jgi:hypothetical protein
LNREDAGRGRTTMNLALAAGGVASTLTAGWLVTLVQECED